MSGLAPILPWRRSCPLNFCQSACEPAHRPLLAGEDAETIRPTLSYLADNGIGGILDYAAESDVSAEVRRHS